MRSKSDATKASRRADGFLVDALGEEGHVVLALIEHGAEGVLQQVLGEVRVVGEVSEGDLRLHHPELGQVPAGVRVLRSERGPEGVDPGHRQAVGLDVELARDREEGRPTEEVLAEVDGTVTAARQVRQIEGRDAEHLARALGVRRGDDRRVDPVEAVLVEVAVDGLGQGVAHAGDGADGVGAYAQMRHLAQVLERVALGRDRVGIGIVDPADHADRLGLHLDRLALAL